MTGRNPNVFYEVGYAHALDKLTVLLTRNADDIPFDLKHFPHIVYEGKISMLQSELERTVRYFVENPPDKSSGIKLGFELFLGDEDLSSGKTVFEFQPKDYASFTIIVFNSSMNTCSSEDFRISIQTSERFVSFDNQRLNTIQLPKGKSLHTPLHFETLLPETYASYSFPLFIPYGFETDEEELVKVKLSTKQGSYEFPLTLRRVAVKV